MPNHFTSRILLIITCIVFSFFSSKASSVTFNYYIHNASHISNANSDSLRIVQMQQRLQAIQSMDLSNLSTSEKKDLRSELNQMMKEAKKYNHTAAVAGSGVYIPIGTLLIIIIVLLIVLR